MKTMLISKSGRFADSAPSMKQVDVVKGETIPVSDYVAQCIMEENYGGIAKEEPTKELPKLPDDATKATKAKTKTKK